MPLMWKHFVPNNLALGIQAVFVCDTVGARQKSPLLIPNRASRFCICRAGNSLHDCLEPFQCAPIQQSWLILRAPSLDIRHEDVHSHQSRRMIAVFHSVRMEPPRTQRVENAPERKEKEGHNELWFGKLRLKMFRECRAIAAEQVLQHHLRHVSVRVNFHCLPSHCCFNVVRKAQLIRIGSFRSGNTSSGLKAVSMEYVAQLMADEYLHVHGEKCPSLINDLGLSLSHSQDRSNHRGNCHVCRNVHDLPNRRIRDCHTCKVIHIERQSVRFPGCNVIKVDRTHVISRLDLRKIRTVATVDFDSQLFDRSIEYRIAKIQNFQASGECLSKDGVRMRREVTTEC